MSLRSYIMAIVGLLLALALGAQWWVNQQHARTLEAVFAKTVFETARDTIGNALFDANIHRTLFPVQELELHLIESQKGAQIEVISSHIENTFNINDSALRQLITQNNQRQKTLTVLVLLIALIALFLVALTITRPLKIMRDATTKISQGKWGEKITVQASHIAEIQDTISAFNAMSHELKKLEEEQLRASYRENVAVFSDTSKSFAHALRNPLHALGLALAELKETELTPQKKDQLFALSQRQIDRVNAWITTMLSYQTDSSENEAWHDIAEILTSLIKSHPASFQIQFVNFTPGYQLLCHPLEVQSIVLAILSNALEASDQTENVALSLTSKKAGFALTIADQGIGIPSNVRTKLFQPHVTNKPNGTGMGLYLARRMMKGLFNGEITITENTPKGTVVELHFKSGKIV